MHSAHTGHIIRCRCDGERKKPSDSFLPFLFGTSFNIPSYAFPAARFSLTLPYEELVFTMAHCTTKNHLHRLLIYCHNDWTSVLLNIFYILQHSLFGIARVFCLLRFLPLSLFLSLFPSLSQPSSYFSPSATISSLIVHGAHTKQAQAAKVRLQRWTKTLAFENTSGTFAKTKEYGREKKWPKESDSSRESFGKKGTKSEEMVRGSLQHKKHSNEIVFSSMNLRKCEELRNEQRKREKKTTRKRQPGKKKQFATVEFYYSLCVMRAEPMRWKRTKRLPQYAEASFCVYSKMYSIRDGMI